MYSLLNIIRLYCILFKISVHINYCKLTTLRFVSVGIGMGQSPSSHAIVLTCLNAIHSWGCFGDVSIFYLKKKTN